MKPHEILAEIRSRVTTSTHEWMCGIADEIEQELIVIGDRDGIEAAVDAAEALATN